MQFHRNRTLIETQAFLVGLIFLLSTAAWSQTNDQSLPAHRVRTREDWSSLSLEGSDLHAEKPVFGEKFDSPKFTRELIQVQWRAGDPIDLYIIRPKGITKPPVILYLYGYPSETDRFRNNDYCERLTKDGFAAIGFVSALTGHRYINRPMKEWFVSELQEALVSSVHDVQMILNFLGERGDVDTSKVGMFGQGSGGTIAVLAAAIDPRIQVIDLLNPWGDWPDWMAKSLLIPEVERPNYVKPEFLKKIAPFDPVQWLPQLKTQHIRIEQVLDDTNTPKAAKERIEAAAPSKATIQSYDSMQQFFMAVSGDRIFRWTKEQLQPAPAAARIQGGESAPAAPAAR